MLLVMEKHKEKREWGRKIVTAREEKGLVPLVLEKGAKKEKEKEKER